MRKGDGVRPHESAKHLPEAQCRYWILDTSPYRRMLSSGEFDIPRQRWKEKGIPRSRALDILRSRVERLRQGKPAVLSEEVEHETTKKATPLTLAQYCEERYLPWLSRKEPSTLANRRKHMKIIGPILGHMTLAEVATPQGITLLYDHLQNATFFKGGEIRPYKHTYKNNIMISLSAIITHASDRHTCSPPLCENISCPTFKAPKGRAHGQVDGYDAGHLRHLALPEGDVVRLLNACQRMDDPDYFYVLVGLGLVGCRVGEAAGRKWSDVDFDQGTLFIHSQISGETDQYLPYTKNKVERTVGLNPDLLEAMRRLQRTSASEFILGGRTSRGGKGTHEKPFLSTRNMGDRYCHVYKEAFGRESRRYHALRHRYATSLADHRVPVLEIKALLGHMKIATTYGYISVNQDSALAASRALTFGTKLEALPGGRRVG